MDKKERRDVIRSREAIKTAFLELIVLKPTEKITISEIIEHADISRGTFYAHYKNLYEVRDQVVDDLLEKFKSTMTEDDIKKIAKDPISQITTVMNIIEKYSIPIKNLSKGSYEGIVSKLKELCIKTILSGLHVVSDTTLLPLIDTCVIGAVVDGCLAYCLQDEKPYSSERAVAVIRDLITGGVDKLAGKYCEGQK